MYLKYLFIPLDIFAKSQQNKDIANKSDGWLTLFSSDEPDVIIGLLEKYPEFRDIYGEAYQICLNIEKVMEMFSEELRELDRNTVWYMIDELKKENKRWKEKDRQNTEEITRLRKEVEEMRSALLKESRELGEQGV